MMKNRTKNLNGFVSKMTMMERNDDYDDDDGGGSGGGGGGDDDDRDDDLGLALPGKDDKKMKEQENGEAIRQLRDENGRYGNSKHEE